jgi:hypothetical protein
MYIEKLFRSSQTCSSFFMKEEVKVWLDFSTLHVGGRGRVCRDMRYGVTSQEEREREREREREGGRASLNASKVEGGTKEEERVRILQA